MSEYNWQWEPGAGPHEWLRDKSGIVGRRRMAKSGSASASASIGHIEPIGTGWTVSAWIPTRELAVLPSTMTRDEVKAVAKIILISEYHAQVARHD